MKDETFTFIETVKERADPARSAFKKGKHKGCMLPHENLTRKELNKMNGEVNTINLNKPMKWAEFKALDADIQQRYIKRLRDLYNVSVDALAGMFGLYPNTVHKMFRIMGLADGKRHRMTWQQKCAFEAFYKGTPTEEIDADKKDDARSKGYVFLNEVYSDVPPIDEPVADMDTIVDTINKPEEDPPVARLSTASFSYHNIDKSSASVLGDLLEGYLRALPGTYKVTVTIEEE